MSKIGVGTHIYEIRKKIQDLQLELEALGDPISEIPELINSSNLLRSNEYLIKVSKKQSELLSVYAQYSKSLEDMISEIFEIQNDLKNVLKEQSELISDTKPSDVMGTKRKTSKRKTSKRSA